MKEVKLRSQSGAKNPSLQQKSTTLQPQSSVSSQSAAHAQPFQLTPNNILTMQRTVGNHVVQRLLADHAAQNRAAQGSIVVQPKLKVGAAHDRYEEEADHVARQVTTNMDSARVPQQPATQPHSIQRLPTPPVGAAGGPVSSALETRIQGAAKGGKSIQPQIRRAVESATGADMSGARYHDDKNAHAINAELGAQAATHKSHIFLGAGQSPSNVQLMAHELTHTVQQGGAPVQRLFGKKEKLPTSDKTMFDTGQAPANAFLTVRAAVKMGTAVRGAGSLKTLLAGGAGHSWLEIQLGPAFPTLASLAADPDGLSIVSMMSDTTKQELTTKRRTTIGFYPDIRTAAITKSKLAQQIASNLPGHLLEPEQATFAGTERSRQGYPVTDATQAKNLFSVIDSYRAKPYNVYRNNCTDFVNKAITRLGYSMGKISGSLGITLPTLLYKQMYKRAELGDRSASYTALEKKTSKSGKQYDMKHMNKKSQKKLDKQKVKAAPMLAARAKQELWAKAIGTYTAPAFIQLRRGGMTRPNETVFGVTGVVKGGWGEVILGNSLDEIDLHGFASAFGFPYPQQEPGNVSRGGDALVEQETIDDLDQMDINDVDDENESEQEF